MSDLLRGGWRRQRRGIAAGRAIALFVYARDMQKKGVLGELA